MIYYFCNFLDFYKKLGENIFLPCINICITVEVFASQKKEFSLVDTLFAECLAVVHPIDWQKKEVTTRGEVANGQS